MNLRHKKKIEHTNLGLMLWHGVRSYGGVIGKTKKNGLKTGVRSYGGVIEIRRIYHPAFNRIYGTVQNICSGGHG